MDNATVHIYLPMTMTGLAAALQAGVIGPAPIDGFTVTPGLRVAFAGEDDEELEYAAQNHAATASLSRLAGDPSAPRRRVVVAVDLDPASIEDLDGLEVGAVVLREQVAITHVVSALVDDPVASTDIARAVADPDDPEVAADVADHQLLWFAVQELNDLVVER